MGYTAGLGQIPGVGDSGAVAGNPLAYNGTSWAPQATNRTATLTTTNATPVYLFTVALSTATSYVFRVTVTCRDDGTTFRSGYVRTVMAYREGGGAVLGTVQSDYTDESDAALDCTFDVSGNNLRVKITGKAAKTVSWSGALEYTEAGDIVSGQTSMMLHFGGVVTVAGASTEILWAGGHWNSATLDSNENVAKKYPIPFAGTITRLVHSTAAGSNSSTQFAIRKNSSDSQTLTLAGASGVLAANVSVASGDYITVRAAGGQAAGGSLIGLLLEDTNGFGGCTFPFGQHSFSNTRAAAAGGSAQVGQSSIDLVSNNYKGRWYVPKAGVMTAISWGEIIHAVDLKLYKNGSVVSTVAAADRDELFAAIDISVAEGDYIQLESVGTDRGSMQVHMEQPA